MKNETLELIEACESNDEYFIKNFVISKRYDLSEDEKDAVLLASKNLNVEMSLLVIAWARYGLVVQTSVSFLFTPTSAGFIK